MIARAGLPLAALLLAGGTAAVAQERAVPGETVIHAPQAKTVDAPAKYFTGRVRVTMLADPVAPGQAGTAMVAFAPGARSNWHTHPAGQTLYVTKGCGWAQAEGEPVRRICAGDIVYTPPGVKHWHGATDRTGMTHLAITEKLDGENVRWMEPVTAAQYHGPAR